MYNLTKENYTNSGHIKKEDYKNLSNFDKVLSYLINWDKSKGQKYLLSSAQVRSRFISNVYRLMNNTNQLPKMDIQFEFIYENFKEFKLLINQMHNSDTLEDLI